MRSGYSMKETTKDVSIIGQIINGSVEIKSTEEFERTLKMFPDNPELNRAFADFLVQKKTFIVACNEYRKAAQLFIDSGMPLQAIAAKINEWKIIKPLTKDYRSFYSTLSNGKFPATVLGDCFSKISYQEMSSVMDIMEVMSMPAKKGIIKAGAEEEALYFIVSGQIREAPMKKTKTGNESVGKAIREYGVNDFFGNIYPFDKSRKSKNAFYTTGRTELIKITKTDLATVCAEHPDLETGLKNLFKHFKQKGAGKAAINEKEIIRTSSRQQLNIKMNVEIYPETLGRSPLIYHGHSSDISLGGVCIILDENYRETPSSNMIGRIARVLINLPDETVSLNILGKLAWCKEVDLDGEFSGAIGIQFNEMPPSLRGLLIIFANAIGSAA